MPPATISWTAIPWMTALGKNRRTLASIEPKPSATASASCRFSRTPPTSVLCRMSGETILRATGKPIRVAVATASSTVRVRTFWGRRKP